MVPAVIEREGEVYSRVAYGAPFGVFDHLANVVLHPQSIADDADACATRDKFVQIVAKIEPEQTHQRADFGRRTLPVFRRERE